MKKQMKYMLAIAGLFAVPLINYMLFKKSDSYSKTKLREKTFSWRYGEIRYIVAGSGRPLLLVHGLGIGLGLHEWEQNIQMLAKHYTVYALDLIGFGFSDKPKLSYSAYMQTQLVLDFINGVVKEPVYVCASSHSANIVMLASAFHKELFAKMILINPVEAPMPSRKDTLFRKLLETPYIGTTVYALLSSKASIQYFLKKHVYALNANVTKNVVDRYYRAAHYNGVDSKFAASAFMSKFLNTDIFGKLHTTEIPTHIILGGMESPVIQNTVLKLSEQNKKIDVTTFHHCKRLPHTESPKEFYKLCKRFF